MKCIMLAPDSFKGTLSAREVCDIEERAILSILPNAQIISLPLSDGGEGLSETCLSIFGGERVCAEVTGPNGKPVCAAYVLLPDGSAAIEMAGAAGLPLMCGKPDPMHATTRGVGELLLDAKQRGAKKILLGLGGSATNDCGIGMAHALGFRFFDKKGAEAEPLAENLGVIAKIQKPKEEYRLPVEAACDVDNPLLGKQGATYTFGPQKGASAEQLRQLEYGMTSFAAVMTKEFPEFDPDTPGNGAAGGMGAAVLTMLKGSLHRGIDLVLDAAGFDELAEACDLVITGEGRLDAQTKHGKVPQGVLVRAQRVGKSCLAVCGCVAEEEKCRREHSFSGIYAASSGERDLEEIKKTCRADLTAATIRAITEEMKKESSRK